MNKQKEAWQSLTIKNGMIQIMLGIAGLFGYAIPREDAIIYVGGILMIVQGVLTVYGRWRATKMIIRR